MPITPLPKALLPDFWNTFGHSYLQISFGTLWNTGRMDSIFRAVMDCEHNNWRGRAKDGARLTSDGRGQSGYVRVLQEMVTARGAGPYVNDAGATLMAWGINDLGNTGVDSITRTAWKNCLRAVISRCRLAALFENTDASVSYGAGFSLATGTETFSSGTSVHQATATTNANLTITIPADYKGETIAVCLVGQSGSGLFGGSATFSGTAGMTGTISNSAQGAVGSHAPVVRRYVAPVTGATQTIILTVNSLDAGGAFYFDCWWLESIVPPPVLVCNIARLTVAGYALYPSWSGTEAAKDADVGNFNADLLSIVAEFDSMVQVVDLDLVLNKDASLYGDGLHPNELGAAKCAQACVDALARIRPTTAYGYVAHMNPSSPRGGQVMRPRRSGFWYTADSKGFGSNYTAVAQDDFAIPILVTSGRERWVQMAVEAIASVTGTAIRWGIYDDRGWDGYPQNLIIEATSAGAFTITTGAGVKVGPASSTGSINQVVDPGIYWLRLKFTTVGVTHTFRTLAGPSACMPNLFTDGGGSVAASGYKLTSQGTGAMSDTYPSGGVLTDNCPYVGVKMN